MQQSHTVREILIQRPQALPRGRRARPATIPILLGLCGALLAGPAFPQQSPPDAEVAAAFVPMHALGGTWTGIAFTRGDPKPISTVQRFDADGHPRFEYFDRRGSHEVALTRVGQIVPFAPKRGGAGQFKVLALDIRPDSVEFAIEELTLRTDGAFSDRTQNVIRRAFLLDGSQLHFAASLVRAASSNGLSTGYGSTLAVAGQSSNDVRVTGILTRK